MCNICSKSNLLFDTGDAKANFKWIENSGHLSNCLNSSLDSDIFIFPNPSTDPSLEAGGGGEGICMNTLDLPICDREQDPIFLSTPISVTEDGGGEGVTIPIDCLSPG